MVYNRFSPTFYLLGAAGEMRKTPAEGIEPRSSCVEPGGPAGSATALAAETPHPGRIRRPRPFFSSPGLSSSEPPSPELSSSELPSSEPPSSELPSSVSPSSGLSSSELFSPELSSPELFSCKLSSSELFSPELSSPELFSCKLSSSEWNE